jgi:hypothetical protein
MKPATRPSAEDRFGYEFSHSQGQGTNPLARESAAREAEELSEVHGTI